MVILTSILVHLQELAKVNVNAEVIHCFDLKGPWPCLI
jgi:hypothetical protein